MLTEAETDTPTQPLVDGSQAVEAGAEAEAEPEGKTERKTEGKAEGDAEPSDADVVRARQSIEAIGIMTENLRVFLQSKK